MRNYKEEYNRWCRQLEAGEPTRDPELVSELKNMKDAQIEDAFYRDLAFGTGGLRGIIGAGTNRMNRFTVAKASQGLADYMNKDAADKNKDGMPSVVIGYDSRIQSDLFAKTAAAVFAENGIQVYIWPRLLPVSTVSFAVRYLHASAGVMITASHNPCQYNGYKVYGADGCQITTRAARNILSEIEKLDIFANVKSGNYEKAFVDGKIRNIPEEVLTVFLDEVKKQSVLYGESVNRNVSIVYSPLNGTGLEPVTRILRESGYGKVTVVKEQEQPDGHFTTCPYPNPEIKEAMALGIEYAEKMQADLLLATDPDCDRVGIAVRDVEGLRGKAGEYVLLTGNEVGLLMLDYICSQRIKHGRMPQDPVMVKTIVTMDLAEKIAESYGVRTINVLTGFKYIGEQIGKLEQKKCLNSYLFGFEESYGYLSGTYVRDKDGVNGAFLICEMFSYYAAAGISLLDKLQELFEKFGYCLNTLHSYQFEGPTGFQAMHDIMEQFRKHIGPGLEQTQFAGKRILRVIDYSDGVDGLPKADVLKYWIEDQCSIVIRPSGTEPKLKVYISVAAKTRGEAEMVEKRLAETLDARWKS